MRKIILQEQNRSKTLELRLENGEPDKYTVIIAGMTVLNFQSCFRVVCAPTSEGDFLFVETKSIALTNSKRLKKPAKFKTATPRNTCITDL